MTNKVKFKLKITGFELEVEGTRESTGQITAQVGDTLRGLMNPAGLADDDSHENGKIQITEEGEATVLSSSPKKKGLRKSKMKKQDGEGKTSAIDFRHDAEKYGNPAQQWNTATKSMWLLYVVRNIANVDGMSSPQIRETFNKHFRQAKTITTTNITRDLGRAKVTSNSFVGEDTTKSPHVWYLTDEGSKHVQKLIAEQKTKGNGTS